jgi:N utilization substance protein A
MAVYSTKEGVDAIGSCIGPKGTRVQAVSEEVCDEKIDIVEYSDDPVIFITNTLAPSKVISVNFDEETKSAVVVVPDDQLSLAIGKRGQNVRLAVRLTGFKIDIKSLSDAKELEIEILNNGNLVSEEDKPAKKVILDIPAAPTPAVAPKKTKKMAPVVEPVVELEEFDDVEVDENKPVVDIETLLQDIREATPTKKVKIKREKTEKKSEDQEEEITFLDIEKPKEDPVVPIYTEEELQKIREEEEKEKEADADYYDDVDYDEFDKYYD